MKKEKDVKEVVEKKTFDTSYTQNRELSWMRFDERVLLEAEDENVPLFERMKFLEIFTSNLDEFYMVRVGSLLGMEQEDPNKRENKTLMTAREQLDKIFSRTLKLYAKRDELYGKLSADLRKEGIYQYRMDELSEAQLKYVEKYFNKQIMPLLSPQIIDSHHPFPKHLNNKQVYIATLLKYKKKNKKKKEKKSKTLGLVALPANVSRCVMLPSKLIKFVLVEDIIRAYAEKIFGSYEVIDHAAFAVTINADIDVDDSGDMELDREDYGGIESDDYVERMRKAITKRRKLEPVRLELQTDGDSMIGKDLIKMLEKLSEAQMFITSSPVSMGYVYGLEDKFTDEQKAKLCYAPFAPVTAEEKFGDTPMMEVVRQQDVLLKYPYDDFGILLKLLREAAVDPDVESIQITIYRVGKGHDLKLMNTLIYAASNGKNITVLLELKARFDEENNMFWINSLEEAGCKILYGFEGYKVHAKVCLITSRKDGAISYITHVGTGNFNAKTAKLYTDLAYLTSDAKIGSDAATFFRNMSIGELHGTYESLLVAPENLKSQLLELIKRETDKAARGEKARMILKMNSLTDRQLIDALHDASMAGVEVDMIVRGISCLLPQKEGATENIRIRNIVGRFLEHYRVFVFGSGDDLAMYIASADWMTRNTEERVEVACPINNKKLRKEILKMLEMQLKDNQKARNMGPDGKYSKVVVKARSRKVNAQQTMMDNARK